MSDSKTLRPVGRIDFLDTKGQTGESCYYYTEEDFLKTVKEENYYGVPMVVNVFRDKNGQTISLGFVNDFDPLPQGFKILDYKEGEDIKPSVRYTQPTRIIRRRENRCLRKKHSSRSAMR